MFTDIILGLAVIIFFIVGFAWKISSTIILQPREIRDEEWLHYRLLPEHLQFMSPDGLKLEGVFIPGTNQATVILLHGYGRCKEQMLPQADFLHRAGFNVFMFDFRASGRSEGKYITFGKREASDLVGAVDYLKKRGDVDMKKIGVLGFSMGGAVALMKSGDVPEIKAIVINSTYAHFKSVIRQNFKEYFSGLPFFPLGWFVLWIIKYRTGIYYANINPILHLDALKARPVMIMHGARDNRIPVADALEFSAQAPWLKEFWLVDGASHEDVYVITKVQYEEKVISFFRKYILSE
jgi:dipeptidyl aminopeptidase/acylaminoacyl peptidase